jgi:hypothetical protein
VPAEYRADLVVLLVDGKPVFAIIVEAQLSPDERKFFTWPVYVVGIRARFECEAVVLVITPSLEVARWASKPITVGPGNSFRAFVLGPNAVPVITDQVRAQSEPELAVLSVMAHGKGEVEQAVQIALAAVSGVGGIADQDLSVLYSDLIYAALSEAARKAFQMLPHGYEFQSETCATPSKRESSQGMPQGSSLRVPLRCSPCWMREAFG